MYRSKHIYGRTVPINPNDKDSLGVIANWIKPKSIVLELGPATGYFTKYMRETLDCVVDCVELSTEMAKKSELYSRNLWVADLDVINLEDKWCTGTYDYIIASDVLEHLKYPAITLKSCRKLLKESGKLFISIPNISHSAVISSLIQGKFTYTDEGLLDRTHLRFFTRSSISELLDKCQYSIEEISVVQKLPEDTEFSDDLSILPRKVSNYLLNLPNSLAYQFVISALPKNSSGCSLSVTSGEYSIDHLRAERKKKLEKQIENLSAALKHAENIVMQRTIEAKEAENIVQNIKATVFNQTKEIDRLRADLAIAEKLAIDRDHELKDIKSSIFWRYGKKIFRRKL